jgi:hypothetical protein
VAVEDDYLALPRSNHYRRAPAAIIGPIPSPDLHTRPFVKGGDVSIAIGVTVLNHEITDEQWRRGGSPGPFELTQISGPEMLPVNAVAV